MRIGNHDSHPFADTFPLMRPEALKSLAASIKANGQQMKGMLYQGKILDGRNRALACEIAKVEPEWDQFTGDDLAAIQYVKAMNIDRRDLTEFDRICALTALGKENAKLMRADKKRAAQERDQGWLTGVPEATLEMHATVEQDAIPELKALVQSGEVSMSRAAAVASSLEPEAQKAAVDELKAYERAEPTRAKSKHDAVTSAAIEVWPIDMVAVRSGLVVLDRSPHAEVRACGALLRRLIPGLGR